MRYFLSSIKTISYWKYALFSKDAIVHFFAAIGALYTVVEILDFFSIYTRDKYGRYAILVFFILALVFVLATRRPISRVTYKAEVYRQLPSLPHGEQRRHGGHDHVRTVGSGGFGVGGRSSSSEAVASEARFSPDRGHEGGRADPTQKPWEARLDQPGRARAGRSPGRRSGEARNAGRVGVGQHLAERVARGQDRHPAHQHLARLLPGVLEPPAVLHGREQRLDAPPLGVARDDLGRGQVRVGADQQALLARPGAPVGPFQSHPDGTHHPAFEEAGRHPAGPVLRDLELAVEDPCGPVERQRFDPLPRHARPVLARPSAPPPPGRPRDRVQREVAARPADHGVAVGDRGLDQPGAHEPGVEQDPHPAEPATE